MKDINKNKIIKTLNYLVSSFKYEKQINFNNYKAINFTPPEYQSGTLHPETKNKFTRIFSIPLSEGIYGPFYRYTPHKCNLFADNDKGGYFTLIKLNCLNCAKRTLWLYDKNRKYFYTKNKKLYRYECYFQIIDDRYSTIFIGEIAYGNAIQIRPNNWIFGNDISENKIYFNPNGVELSINPCKNCKKSFHDIFENK